LRNRCERIRTRRSIVDPTMVLVAVLRATSYASFSKRAPARMVILVDFLTILLSLASRVIIKEVATTEVITEATTEVTTEVTMGVEIREAGERRGNTVTSLVESIKAPVLMPLGGPVLGSWSIRLWRRQTERNPILDIDTVTLLARTP